MHGLLTYGGFAENEITKEEVRDFLFSKRPQGGNLQRYRICMEKYKDPSDPERPYHIHAAFRYDKKLNTKKSFVPTGNETIDEDGTLVPDGGCATPFDITTREGRYVHANIKTHDPKKASKKLRANVAEAASERTMFLYTAKGEQPKEEWEEKHENGDNYGLNADYIEGGDVEQFMKQALQELAEKRSKKDTYRAMLAASSEQEAMDILKREDPEAFCKDGERIRKNVRTHLGGYDEKAYELSDFERAPLDLSHAVLMPGASGMGKTQFAKAHFKYPLVIRTMDRLKQMTDNTDGLIFDDMNFGPGTADKPGLNYTPEQMIHLLDMEEKAAVKLRFGDKTIPAGMPRIFTTNLRVDGPESVRPRDANNNALHPFPYGANREQQKAIDRRYITVPYVEEPLYSKSKAIVKRLMKEIIRNVEKARVEMDQ